MLEPLVQCAGGCACNHPAYLRRVRELCDVHGIFLIADEIAVGFGRTGTMFACEQAGIQPDLMCLSKGLTGGFLPLAAVLATDAITRDSHDSRERAFLHSHSYRQPAGLRRGAGLARHLRGRRRARTQPGHRRAHGRTRARNRALPHVAEARQCGMIVAFELARTRRARFDPASAVGLRAYRAALERGVPLRPLGEVLYWMPPYCIDAAQLDLLANVTAHAIREATT